jgi:hypothetical protein
MTLLFLGLTESREAEQFPEAPRWRSGRALEWLRLRGARTFEADWTWERVKQEHPSYLKSDIGHMFYVYATITNTQASIGYV